MMVGVTRRTHEPTVPARLIGEHEELVQAIASLDPRVAEEAAHAHILRRRGVTLATLQQDLDRASGEAAGPAETQRV